MTEEQQIQQQPRRKSKVPMLILIFLIVLIVFLGKYASGMFDSIPILGPIIFAIVAAVDAFFYYLFLAMFTFAYEQGINSWTLLFGTTFAKIFVSVVLIALGIIGSNSKTGWISRFASIWKTMVIAGILLLVSLISSLLKISFLDVLFDSVPWLNATLVFAIILFIVSIIMLKKTVSNTMRIIGSSLMVASILIALTSILGSRYGELTKYISATGELIFGFAIILLGLTFFGGGLKKFIAGVFQSENVLKLIYKAILVILGAWLISFIIGFLIGPMEILGEIPALSFLASIASLISITRILIWIILILGIAYLILDKFSVWDKLLAGFKKYQAEREANVPQRAPPPPPPPETP